MNNLTLIIIAVVGIGLGYWFACLRQGFLSAGRHDGGQANEKKCKDVEMTDKHKNKQKILDFLRENGRVQNNDVERVCGVSDATATNYLDSLEKEGKIHQVGTTGHAVYYVLK